MPASFLISDTHFGHVGVCRFLREDGSKLRPWTDPDEMDEALVKAWNERVRPNDKVYHLGDVVINRRSLKTLARLNGDKVLIKGNHDIFKLSDYTPYFRDIRGYHVMNGCILSHIPVHSESLARFGCNVHGHLHYNRVRLPNKIDTLGTIPTVVHGKEIDPRYFNVSVECIDFAPILLEDCFKRIVEQGGAVGFHNGNGPTVD